MKEEKSDSSQILLKPENILEAREMYRFLRRTKLFGRKPIQKNYRARRAKGWICCFAAMGVNLCLGMLYTWGAFQTVFREYPFNWSATQTQIPYMVACAVFAITMIPGGYLQDKFGPKPVVMIAAAATFAGFVMSGLFVHSLVALTVSFGVIFGLASGFGYSATTPPAVKWFPFDKRGLISGLIVSGYGLSGVYAAPLTMHLLTNYGISTTFIILGIVYGLAILLLAQLIVNPPSGFAAKTQACVKDIAGAGNIATELGPSKVVKTVQFYMLWIMFFIGSLSSLMIVGQLRSIGLEQAQLTDELAFWLISTYSVFNAAGRVGLGILLDKIGGSTTLVVAFAMRTITFLLFKNFLTAVSIFIGTAIIALTYGGLASIFPAMTANYYGSTNLGANYALVFTAWGAGGVIGPLMGGLIRDTTGTYELSYVLSAVLSFMSVIIALTLKNKFVKEITSSKSR